MTSFKLFIELTVNGYIDLFLKIISRYGILSAQIAYSKSRSVDTVLHLAVSRLEERYLADRIS